MRSIRVEYHFPACLLTDGAYEEQRGDEAGTIGGVLLDPWSRRCWFFSMVIAPQAIAALRVNSENPIVTVELLAIHVGLVLFSAVLAGRPTIGFVDNEPARHAIIRGTSGILEAATVVQGICDTEIEHSPSRAAQAVFHGGCGTCALAPVSPKKCASLLCLAYLLKFVFALSLMTVWFCRGM